MQFFKDMGYVQPNFKPYKDTKFIKDYIEEYHDEDDEDEVENQIKDLIDYLRK